MITLKQAREIMNKGDEFSIRYCSLDVNRKTGGEVVELTGVKLLNPLGNVEVLKGTSNGPKRNYVRVKLANEDIRIIHWLLIEKLNGQSVTL